MNEFLILKIDFDINLNTNGANGARTNGHISINRNKNHSFYYGNLYSVKSY